MEGEAADPTEAEDTEAAEDRMAVEAGMSRLRLRVTAAAEVGKAAIPAATAVATE